MAGDGHVGSPLRWDIGEAQKIAFQSDVTRGQDFLSCLRVGQEQLAHAESVLILTVLLGTFSYRSCVFCGHSRDPQVRLFFRPVP